MGLKQVCTGARFTILGTQEVLDFLSEVEADATTQRDHEGLRHLFEVFAGFGEIRNKEHLRQLNDLPGVMEFKRRQIRVYGVFDGSGRFVLVYGTLKKTDRTPQRVISNILDRVREYRRSR